MAYRLKKDLGGLKKGTQLTFSGGVFVGEGAAFDPMDVITDTEHFEEIVEVQVATESFGTFKTI